MREKQCKEVKAVRKDLVARVSGIDSFDDRISMAPGVIPPGEGTSVPSLLDQCERRTGAASLAGSGAIQDGELLLALCRLPLGDVVQHHPDAVRDGAGVALKL